MKAYKTINYGSETKAVISYTVVFSVISFFIMLSPVFSQEEEEYNNNRPKAEIEINKQYDDDGNIIQYDSSYTWTWHGNSFPIKDLDSVFNKFQSNFNFSRDDNFYYPFDSIDISYFNFDEFDKYLDQDIDIEKYLPDEDFLKNYMPDENFRVQFFKTHDDFMNRYNEYLKEHKKLIEKYFSDPPYEKNNSTNREQNNFFPKKGLYQKDRSGKV